MRYSYLACIMSLLVGLNSPFLQAQSVSATWSADTNAISLGEPVRATFTLTQEKNLRVSWPLLADSLAPLEVLGVGEIDSSESEGAITLTQQFKVTAFDSGAYQLPPVLFSYLVVGESQTRVAKAAPLPITVFTVPVDTTTGPIAMAPMQGEPVSFKEIAAWGGTILLVCAMGFGLWYYLKKRPKPEVIEYKPAPPPIPPYEIAMRDLAKVEAAKYWQKGDFKGYYTALTDVIRVYIEHAFSVPAMESVTDEIMDGLEQKSLPDRVLWPLKELLRQSDLTKFAKFNPDDQANLKAIEVARSFVKETKNWNRREEPTETETPTEPAEPTQA